MEEGQFSSWLLWRVYVGDTLRLRIGRTTIGRHSSSTIRVTKDYVSRRHAEIQVENNDQIVKLKDLESSNGVFVNGTLYKRTSITLNQGDKIGIGVSERPADDNPNEVCPVYILYFTPLTLLPPQILLRPTTPTKNQPITNTVNPSAPLPINQPPKQSSLASDVKPNILDLNALNESSKSKISSSSNAKDESFKSPDKIAGQADNTAKSKIKTENDQDLTIIEIDSDTEEDFSSSTSKANSSLSKPPNKENITKNLTDSSKDQILQKSSSINSSSDDIPSKSNESQTSKDNFFSLNSLTDNKEEKAPKEEKKVEIKKEQPQTSEKPKTKDDDIIILSDDEEVDSIPIKNSQKFDLKKEPSSSAGPPAAPQVPFSVTQNLALLFGEDDAEESAPSKDSEKNSEKTFKIPHLPKIPTFKEEKIDSVTQVVQDIFGDTDEVILDQIKDINAAVYTKLNIRNCREHPETVNNSKMLLSGQKINLFDDDEDDAEILGFLTTAEEEEELLSSALKKSPNIFEDSTEEKNNAAVVEEPQQDENTNKELETKYADIANQGVNQSNITHLSSDELSSNRMTWIPSNNMNDDFRKNDENKDKDKTQNQQKDKNKKVSINIISDIQLPSSSIDWNSQENALSLGRETPDLADEDLMFSQAIIDEMKADVDSENSNDALSTNCSFDELNIFNPIGNDQDTNNANKSNDESWFNAIQEDEDEDEDFKEKVSEWSCRLSQSFTGKSQIYQIPSDDEDSNEKGWNNDNESYNFSNSFSNKETVFDNLFSNVRDKLKEPEPTEQSLSPVSKSDEKKKKLKRRYSVAASSFFKDDCEDSGNKIKICEEDSSQNDESFETLLASPKRSSISNDQSKEILSSPLIRRHSATGTAKSKQLQTSDEEPSSSNEDFMCESKLPIKSNDKSNSPLIRRHSSCSKPLASSSSSDEDSDFTPSKKMKTTAEEAELPQNINENSNPALEKETQKVRVMIPRLPTIIEAPNLPKHKGKLRGVSAHKEEGFIEKRSNIIKQMRDERYTSELVRKWHEKSKSSSKRKRKDSEAIKEVRRNKLKELAEKSSSPSSKPKESAEKSSSSSSSKPKESAEKSSSSSSSKKNVPASKENESELNKTKKEQKTSRAARNSLNSNRGAFLTEDAPKISYRIPKRKEPDTNVHEILSKVLTKDSTNKPKSSSSSNSSSSSSKKHDNKSKPFTDASKTSNEKSSKSKNTNESTTERAKSPSRQAKTSKVNTKPNLERSASAENKSTDFSQELSKLDNAKPSTSNKVPGIRHTKKVSFASMEKNFQENYENLRKIQNITAQVKTNPSSKYDHHSIMLTNKPSSSKKGKSVRFNDVPTVYLIERVEGADRKVDCKDARHITSYYDRCQISSKIFQVIDRTDNIISDILKWSDEWLVNKDANVNAASEQLFPLPNKFRSFEQYSSMFHAHMKLEFQSMLEREYLRMKKAKPFAATVENINAKEERATFVCKVKSRADNFKYDLVIVDISGKMKCFAFVSAIRKGLDSLTVILEVLGGNYKASALQGKREMTIQPAVDNVKVEFGAFNAIHQIKASPLVGGILNPVNFLQFKYFTPRTPVYKGYDRLNDEQRNVLLKTYLRVIDESVPNVTLIHGPPGTGKSCVITNLALQCLYGDEVRALDKKILICAQSNCAVDVVASKLLSIAMKMREEKRFKIVRFGVLDKIDPAVKPIALQNLVKKFHFNKVMAQNENIPTNNMLSLKEQIMELEASIADIKKRNWRGTVLEDDLNKKANQLDLLKKASEQVMRPEDERELFKVFLQNSNVICTTLSSCVKLSQYISYLDICIIDEATQCTEPWTLLPLRFGLSSLVLVGDTQQLPATVLSKKASEFGLGISMFTRIQNCLDLYYAQQDTNPKLENVVAYKLKVQYRMHPEICKWPNLYFYNNELVNADITLSLQSPIVPYAILSLTYNQNANCQNGQIENNLEAEFVAKLLKVMNKYIPTEFNSYGIITPYAVHRIALEKAISKLSGLRGIMVNTIDSYQGVEKDVIIISNARTSGIGFLANYQRLNVALTRPKKCLLLCGNFKSLESVPAWRNLLQNAKERKLHFEISENSLQDLDKHVINKLKNHAYVPPAPMPTPVQNPSNMNPPPPIPNVVNIPLPQPKAMPNFPPMPLMPRLPPIPSWPPTLPPNQQMPQQFQGAPMLPHLHGPPPPRSYLQPSMSSPPLPPPNRNYHHNPTNLHNR